MGVLLVIGLAAGHPSLLQPLQGLAAQSTATTPLANTQAALGSGPIKTKTLHESLQLPN